MKQILLITYLCLLGTVLQSFGQIAIPGTFEAEAPSAVLNGFASVNAYGRDVINYATPVTLSAASYPINISQAGTYKLILDYRMGNADTEVTVNVGGTDLTTFKPADKGAVAWSWASVSVDLNGLTQGLQTLTLTFTSPGWAQESVDKISLIGYTDLPAVLQARESQASGGGWVDNPAGQSYVYTKNGAWLEYYINVPVDALYALSIKYSQLAGADGTEKIAIRSCNEITFTKYYEIGFIV